MCLFFSYFDVFPALTASDVSAEDCSWHTFAAKSDGTTSAATDDAAKSSAKTVTAIEVTTVEVERKTTYPSSFFVAPSASDIKIPEQDLARNCFNPANKHDYSSNLPVNSNAVKLLLGNETNNDLRREEVYSTVCKLSELLDSFNAKVEIQNVGDAIVPSDEPVSAVLEIVGCSGKALNRKTNIDNDFCCTESESKVASTNTSNECIIDENERLEPVHNRRELEFDNDDDVEYTCASPDLKLIEKEEHQSVEDQQDSFSSDLSDAILSPANEDCINSINIETVNSVFNEDRVNVTCDRTQHSKPIGDDSNATLAFPQSLEHSDLTLSRTKDQSCIPGERSVSSLTPRTSKLYSDLYKIWLQNTPAALPSVNLAQAECDRAIWDKKITDTFTSSKLYNAFSVTEPQKKVSRSLFSDITDEKLQINTDKDSAGDFIEKSKLESIYKSQNTKLNLIDTSLDEVTTNSNCFPNSTTDIVATFQASLVASRFLDEVIPSSDANHLTGIGARPKFGAFGDCPVVADGNCPLVFEAEFGSKASFVERIALEQASGASSCRGMERSDQMPSLLCNSSTSEYQGYVFGDIPVFSDPQNICFARGDDLGIHHGHAESKQSILGNNERTSDRRTSFNNGLILPSSQTSCSVTTSADTFIPPSATAFTSAVLASSDTNLHTAQNKFPSLLSGTSSDCVSVPTHSAMSSDPAFLFTQFGHPVPVVIESQQGASMWSGPEETSDGYVGDISSRESSEEREDNDAVLADDEDEEAGNSAKCRPETLLNSVNQTTSNHFSTNSNIGAMFTQHVNDGNVTQTLQREAGLQDMLAQCARDGQPSIEDLKRLRHDQALLFQQLEFQKQQAYSSSSLHPFVHELPVNTNEINTDSTQGQILHDYKLNLQNSLDSKDPDLSYAQFMSSFYNIDEQQDYSSSQIQTPLLPTNTLPSISSGLFSSDADEKANYLLSGSAEPCNLSTPFTTASQLYGDQATEGASLNLKDSNIWSDINANNFSSISSACGNTNQDGLSNQSISQNVANEQGLCETFQSLGLERIWDALDGCAAKSEFDARNKMLQGSSMQQVDYDHAQQRHDTWPPFVQQHNMEDTGYNYSVIDQSQIATRINEINNQVSPMGNDAALLTCSQDDEQQIHFPSSDGPTGIQAVLQHSTKSDFSSVVPKRTMVQGLDNTNKLTTNMDLKRAGNENLLTSPRTHFRPIKLQNDATAGASAANFTETATLAPLNLPYQRSNSGNLYLEKDAIDGSPKKYMVYKDPTDKFQEHRPLYMADQRVPLVPKFKLVNNEKFCQTEETTVEAGSSNSTYMTPPPESDEDYDVFSFQKHDFPSSSAIESSLWMNNSNSSWNDNVSASRFNHSYADSWPSVPMTSTFSRAPGNFTSSNQPESVITSSEQINTSREDWGRSYQADKTVSRNLSCVHETSISSHIPKNNCKHGTDRIIDTPAARAIWSSDPSTSVTATGQHYHQAVIAAQHIDPAIKALWANSPDDKMPSIKNLISNITSRSTNDDELMGAALPAWTMKGYRAKCIEKQIPNEWLDEQSILCSDDQKKVGADSLEQFVEVTSEHVLPPYDDVWSSGDDCGPQDDSYPVVKWSDGGTEGATSDGNWWTTKGAEFSDQYLADLAALAEAQDWEKTVR